MAINRVNTLFSSTTMSIIYGLFTSLGGFIIGFDTGIYATTIHHDSFTTYMFNSHKGNAVLLGAVASTYTAGLSIGGLSAGYFAQRFGRKYTISGGAAVVTIGAAIQTAAQSIGMFIAGRVIGGLAAGFLLSIVPVYNAEIAIARHRGLVVGIFGAMSSFGVLCSNWVGYACQFTSGNAQWRIPLACQMPGSLVLFVASFFLSESPRWLMNQDRMEEAYQAVLRLHGGSQNESPAKEEFAQIRAQGCGQGKAGFLECFKTPSARKRLFLGIFVAIFNNLGGSPVIQVYQAILFADIGFVGNKTLFLSGFYGLAGFCGTLINLAIIADRMPRKQSMWLGAVALVVDLSILAPLSKAYSGSTNASGQAAAVSFIFLHSFMYSVFMYGTVFVYITELFPTALRPSGVAICLFLGNAIGIVFQQIGLQAYQEIGYKFYVVFIACTAFAGVMYYVFLPETKGKTLEEIGAFFGEPVIAEPEEKSGDIFVDVVADGRSEK